LNEYTDWSRPPQQPIALLDSLLDILGDALVVSPLVRSADLNLQLTRTALHSVLTGSGWPSLSDLNNARQARLFSTYNLTGSALSRSWAAQLPDASHSVRASAAASANTASTSTYHHKTRSFFYMFGHQSEHSISTASTSNSGPVVGPPSTDRLASAHGDELPFLFGAPLAQHTTSDGHIFGYFASNFTKSEIALSEAVMIYFTNFAKFG
jgi:neuroligin